MKFIERAIALNSQILREITRHPYKTELAKGILPPQIFKHILIQDAAHLAETAKSWERVSQLVKCPRQQKLCRYIGARDLSNSMEIRIKFGISVQDAKFEFKEYLHFLKRQRHAENCALIAASLVPCYYVYNNIGQTLMRNTTPTNPYKSWIDQQYLNPSLPIKTRALIDMIDAIADKVSPITRISMHKIFGEAMKLELGFIVHAYPHKTWVSNLEIV